MSTTLYQYNLLLGCYATENNDEGNSWRELDYCENMEKLKAKEEIVYYRVDNAHLSSLFLLPGSEIVVGKKDKNGKMIAKATAIEDLDIFNCYSKIRLPAIKPKDIEAAQEAVEELKKTVENTKTTRLKLLKMLVEHPRFMSNRIIAHDFGKELVAIFTENMYDDTAKSYLFDRRCHIAQSRMAALFLNLNTDVPLETRFMMYRVMLVPSKRPLIFEERSNLIYDRIIRIEEVIKKTPVKVITHPEPYFNVFGFTVAPIGKVVDDPK